MNICILYGRILSKIEFNFLYNSKLHISLAKFKICLIDKQIISIKAYDEQADKIYRKLRKGDFVIIEGFINKKDVNVKYIYKVK